MWGSSLRSSWVDTFTSTRRPAASVFHFPGIWLGCHILGWGRGEKHHLLLTFQDPRRARPGPAHHRVKPQLVLSEWLSCPQHMEMSHWAPPCPCSNGSAPESNQSVQPCLLSSDEPRTPSLTYTSFVNKMSCLLEPKALSFVLTLTFLLLPARHPWVFLCMLIYVYIYMMFYAFKNILRSQN